RSALQIATKKECWRQKLLGYFACWRWCWVENWTACGDWPERLPCPCLCCCLSLTLSDCLPGHLQGQQLRGEQGGCGVCRLRYRIRLCKGFVFTPAVLHLCLNLSLTPSWSWWSCKAVSMRMPACLVTPWLEFWISEEERQSESTSREE